MNDEIETNRMIAEGSPDPTAGDEKSVYAKGAQGSGFRVQDSPNPEPRTLTTPPTKLQLRSLVDVVSADVRRVIKKTLKPADVEMLVRVAERAVKLSLLVRSTPTDAPTKTLAKLDAQRKQVESQLAAIKSIGSSMAAKTFWNITDAAIDRLAAFTLTAIVAI